MAAEGEQALAEALADDDLNGLSDADYASDDSSGAFDLHHETARADSMNAAAGGNGPGSEMVCSRARGGGGGDRRSRLAVRVTVSMSVIAEAPPAP